MIPWGVKMSRNIIDLMAIIDKGETLELADGSKFRVDPFDLAEVMTWSASNELELRQTRDRVFNYTLTNRDRSSWIRAMKLN